MAATSPRLRLLAEENDLQAVRTDPTGVLYAVLQVLRAGENFTEADFAVLIERGAQHAREQGGMLRHAQDVREREERTGVRPRPAPPTQIRAQRAPKKRVTPSGEVSYAGTEAEAEAVAEAERLRQQGVGPVEFELEREDVEAVDDGTITLTNAQLQRLMQGVAAKARAAVTPKPAEDVEVEEDPDGEPDLPDPEPLEDLEQEPHDEDAPEAEPDAESDQSDRGRDDSGRFVTTKPKGK